MRAGIDPRKIFVIANAVDTAMFTPDPKQRDSSKSKYYKDINVRFISKLPTRVFAVTIVVISRLVYRKGVDLLAGLIPIMCNTYKNVQFLIGGDGPKRIVIEEVVEKNCLQDRVTLLGAV